MDAAGLEGRYESEPTKGPGTRYRLELRGDTFRLSEQAWMLGRGASGPAVELIGERVLEGTFSTDDGALVLAASRRTDTPAGRPSPPAPVPASLELRADVLAGDRPALRLAIHGRAVALRRAD